MATKIYPSQNDVGVSAGDGRIPTEASMSDRLFSSMPFQSRHRNGTGVGSGGVVSGFDINTVTATLATFNAGTALIRGFKVEETATTTATLLVDKFNWVFLRLTKTASLVTGLAYTVNSSTNFDDTFGSPPADSILIACLKSGPVVNEVIYDYRSGPSNVVLGQYVGDGTAVRSVNVGFMPRGVIVVGEDTPRLVAMSDLSIPLESVQTGFGWFIAEHTSGEPGVCGITNSKELRPTIEATGFKVEDGPVAVKGRIIDASTTWNPPSIANLTAASLATVTVTGAVVGDIAIGSHSLAVQSGWIQAATVISADTVDFTLLNHTGATRNLASGTVRIKVFKIGDTNFSLNTNTDKYYFMAWY